jgi:hypothetical protein
MRSALVLALYNLSHLSTEVVERFQRTVTGALQPLRQLQRPSRVTYTREIYKSRAHMSCIDDVEVVEVVEDKQQSRKTALQPL